MLHIYFSKDDRIDPYLSEDIYRICPTAWFDNQGGSKYIDGAIEQQIINDIDESEVFKGTVLLHPFYGAYPPEKLSGTTKTLILINNEPQYYYNGAFLGENACPWLLKIAADKDVYLRMSYILPFEQDFNCHFINTNKYTTTYNDYLIECLHVSQEGV